jgi:hypothetical protein
MLRSHRLITTSNGHVHSTDGWVLRPIGSDVFEYDDGCGTCLINVGSPTRHAVRPIYASESTSELFPDLGDRLRAALPYLRGNYVVV